MRKTMFIGMLTGVLLLGRGPQLPEPNTGLPGMVLEVACDSLQDVAVAVYSPWRGIIYYNPALQRRLGPDLTAFFRAHEFGHLYFHHTRANAMAGTGASSADRLLQGRELEADCYATRRLAASHRAAVDAALRFFSRMGGFRFDTQHPTGAERAVRILACLPTPASGGR